MISIDSLHDTPLNCSLKNPLALVRAKVHVGCMYALDVYSLPLLRYICVENSASIALLKKKKMLRLTPNSLAVSDIGQKVLGFTHPVHRAYCRIEKKRITE